MILVEPISNSTFHSLQLTGESRFSKGFSVLANYTWSKSIDDGSANKGNGITHANPFNNGYEKGPPISIIPRCSRLPACGSFRCTSPTDSRTR